MRGSPVFSIQRNRFGCAEWLWDGERRHFKIMRNRNAKQTRSRLKGKKFRVEPISDGGAVVVSIIECADRRALFFGKRHGEMIVIRRGRTRGTSSGLKEIEKPMNSK